MTVDMLVALLPRKYSMLQSDARLLPCLIGGFLVAILAWAFVRLTSLHGHGHSTVSGLAVGVGLFILTTTVAATAPSRPSTWRRLLLIAAAISFAVAWAVWASALGTSPDTIQGTRAENAPGFALLALLGVLVLAMLGPAVFVALGLVLALAAWILGREAKLPRRNWDEGSLPPDSQ